ncbi:MAG: LptF/LptG family permease [Spirochaetaceae bacterium]
MNGNHRIERYVAREVLFSFFVAFLFFFFIFFVNQLLLLAEDILEKQVPVIDVLMLLVYSLPSWIALAVPFGSLLGCLMALGRLANDNEVIAIRAAGISMARIFRPVLMIGVGLTLVSFIVNDYFLPIGNLNLVRRYRELVLSNPDLEFEPFAIREFQDLVLVSGDVPDGTIEQLMIIETGRGGRERIISAGRAELQEDAAESGVISLNMSDVFVHDPVGGNAEDFDFSRSETMNYNILLRDIAFSIQNPTAREMSSVDVLEMVRSQEADLELRQSEQQMIVDRTRAELLLRYQILQQATIEDAAAQQIATGELESLWNRYVTERDRSVHSRTLQVNRIEFHKKFSIPAACLAFVIFAFPVGVRGRTSTRSVGFGLGLFVSFLYWGAIFAGQTVGIQQPQIPAFLTMWAPNVILAVLGALLFAHGRRA